MSERFRFAVVGCGMAAKPHALALQSLADEEGLAQMTKYIPAGFMGAPEDIAYCMLYLASDEARYITAQTLNVDGGNWMS